MGRFKYLMLFIILVAVLPGVSQNSKSSRLPYRVQLSGEIKFWKKVFSELSLNQYLIHDSENLSILYKVVTFDSSVSERNREKELKAVKEEIKDLLLKFHDAEPAMSELSGWELKLYRQFQHSGDPQKFRRASRRIRAQQGIRENFLAGLQRSYAYLPYLEKVFQEEGLPHELIYLPHVESSFNPAAVSHVGAAGMWQFMRRTARLYMKVNRVMDERFDPLVSTAAAARLLKYNYNVLKDWALAITAYNHGLGSMRKAKRRLGRDYMKIREKYLRRSFGFASKNFYPEFLAVVEMMDSLQYYFPEVRKDPPLAFKEIKLPKKIKLSRFARQFNLELDTLKALNPAYRRQVWNGTRSVPAGYAVRLPIPVDAQKLLAALGADTDDIQTATVVSSTAAPELKTIVFQRQYLVASSELQSSLQVKRPGVATDFSNAVIFQEVTAQAAVSSGQELDTPLLAVAASSTNYRTGEIRFSKPGVNETFTDWEPFNDAALSPIANPATLAVAASSTDYRTGEIRFSKSGVNETFTDWEPFNDAAFSPIANLAIVAVQETPAAPPETGLREESLFAAVSFLKPGVESQGAPLPAVMDDLLDLPQEEELLHRFAATSSVDFRKHQVDNSGAIEYLNFEQWVLTATEEQKLSLQEIWPILSKGLTITNGTAIVYPEETLGHFSEWLNISLRRLRRINQISRKHKIYTGQQLRLDFSKVRPSEFYQKRLNYHLNIIQELLRESSGIKLVDYTVNPGENIWYLAHKKYKFPVNLLLYFNDLYKLEHLYPGDVIKLPITYN